MDLDGKKCVLKCLRSMRLGLSESKRDLAAVCSLPSAIWCLYRCFVVVLPTSNILKYDLMFSSHIAPLNFTNTNTNEIQYHAKQPYWTQQYRISQRWQYFFVFAIEIHGKNSLKISFVPSECYF